MCVCVCVCMCGGAGDSPVGSKHLMALYHVNVIVVLKVKFSNNVRYVYVVVSSKVNHQRMTGGAAVPNLFETAFFDWSVGGDFHIHTS